MIKNFRIPKQNERVKINIIVLLILINFLGILFGCKSYYSIDYNLKSIIENLYSSESQMISMINILCLILSFISGIFLYSNPLLILAFFFNGVGKGINYIISLTLINNQNIIISLAIKIIFDAICFVFLLLQGNETNKINTIIHKKLSEKNTINENIDFKLYSLKFVILLTIISLLEIILYFIF